jgi:hypothetical protein
MDGKLADLNRAQSEKTLKTLAWVLHLAALSLFAEDGGLFAVEGC